MSNLWRLFTQVFSYVANRVAKRRLPLLEEEEEEDYLLSICPHMGKSLHGLWHMTVHIQARHCMEILVESAIIILQWVGTQFLHKAIQESHCSRSKQKSLYSKKMETTDSFQVWNIKEGGSMQSPRGMNHHVWSKQSPVRKRSGFPDSPCHKTKKDSWCGRVPQTKWQGKSFYLVSQQG